MSNQIRLLVTNEQSNTVATQNNNKIINTLRKKKKLSLTNELMIGIMEFKRMIISQKHNRKISFLDPVKQKKLKSSNEEYTAKRMLHSNIQSLQEAIVSERSLRREYVANVTRYADECRDLERAKDVHIESLEQMLAAEDRVIVQLRADIEDAYDAYETLRRRFYGLYADQRCGDGDGLARAVAGRLEQCCDDASDTAEVRDIVASLRAGVHALVADVCASKSDGNGGGGTRTDSFAALCRAIDSMGERNRTLANRANELDSQTESLQASLSEVATEYMTLSASKSDKMCRAVVLDDLCAVTEQITVQQMRNLEFSRILAVDDDQLAEELDKIEQLNANISKKKNKKQKLLKETDSIKSQLEVFKKQYEELEKRRAFLTEDLNSVKRSPTKLANETELQGVGQRAKHLKQLKVHFNTLTNKRDALKMKLRKQQQVTKIPSRIN